MAGQPSNRPLATSFSTASGVMKGSERPGLPSSTPAKSWRAISMRLAWSGMRGTIRPTGNGCRPTSGRGTVRTMDDSIAQLLSLDGKVALVTGAATGIGESIATVLAAPGPTSS